MDKKQFFQMKKRGNKSVNRDSYASLPDGKSEFKCEAFYTDEFPFTGQEGTWVGIVAYKDKKAYRFGANAFFNALGLYSAAEKDNFETTFGKVGFTNTVNVTDDGKEWEEKLPNEVGHKVNDDDNEEEDDNEDVEEVAPKKKSKK